MTTIQAAAILALLLLTCNAGCSIGTSVADGPIESYELDGQWCSDATPLQVCLIVSHPPTSPTARYLWSVPASRCYERGDLTGGLEFLPDPPGETDLCLAQEYDLYSAAGSWTATGIRLLVDAAPASVRASSSLYDELELTLHYMP